MASKTTNYNMHKIDLADSPPDITVLNPNFDIIDTEMKAQGNVLTQHLDETKQWIMATHDGQVIPSGAYTDLNYTNLSNRNNATFAQIINNRVVLKKGVYHIILHSAFAPNGTGVRFLALTDAVSSTGATAGANAPLVTSTIQNIVTDNTILITQAYQNCGSNLALGTTILKVIRVGDLT